MYVPIKLYTKKKYVQFFFMNNTRVSDFLNAIISRKMDMQQNVVSYTSRSTNASIEYECSYMIFIYVYTYSELKTKMLVYKI